MYADDLFFLFRFGVTDRGGCRRPAAAFADRGRVLYLPGEPGGAEGGRVSPSLGASAMPAWWRGAPGLVAQGVCACVRVCARAVVVHLLDFSLFDGVIGRIHPLLR